MSVATVLAAAAALAAAALLALASLISAPESKSESGENHAGCVRVACAVLIF